jgi:hypothetical protein
MKERHDTHAYFDVSINIGMASAMALKKAATGKFA